MLLEDSLADGLLLFGDEAALVLGFEAATGRFCGVGVVTWHTSRHIYFHLCRLDVAMEQVENLFQVFQLQIISRAFPGRLIVFIIDARHWHPFKQVLNFDRCLLVIVLVQLRRQQMHSLFGIDRGRSLNLIRCLRVEGLCLDLLNRLGRLH